jgi:hypothetical protein
VSAEAVAEILARALRERPFAELLRSEPERALAGYELIADERAAIVGSAPPASGPSTLAARPRAAARLV